jgi:hypothetical protein
MKTLRIELPPFEYAIIVVVGDFTSCHRFICKRLGHDFPPYPPSMGRCYHTDGWLPHIWLPHKPRTPREIGTLAHEAAHASLWLMDWSHSSATAGDDEFFGHTIGYIVSQVLARL